LIGLLAFVALVSGAYPALYVSQFNTTAIFSGKQQFGEKSTLRRVLLGAQFTMAYLAVIVSIVLFVSGGDFKKMPWGYKAQQTLVIPLSDSTQYSMLKNELLKNAQIESVAGAANQIGHRWEDQIVEIAGQKQEIGRYNVGEGYDRAMGLPLTSGRFFLPGEGDENSVVVSEYFAQKQGWDDPIGKTFSIEQQDYAVVGVMADVKTVPTNAPRPIVYFRVKASQYNYLVARFAPGSGKAVAAQTEQTFQRLFAGLPARHFFQNEVFDSFDQKFRDLSTSFSYVALLALILACMGLYGLATQHYVRRLKEVSVRKLLGASVGQVSLLVNRHFGWMLLIAGGLASVLCWVAAELLLSNLSNYVGSYRPGIWPFALANLLVWLTAAATIGQQTWKMTRVKLAETLKNSD
jgi:putative ABC transport system permease protein